MADDSGMGPREAEFVLTVRWDNGEILTANRAVWRAMRKERDDIVGGFYDGVMKDGVPTTLETNPEAVADMCRIADADDTRTILGPIDELWMPAGAAEPLRIQTWLRWTNYQLKHKLGRSSTVGAFIIRARRALPQSSDFEAKQRAQEQEVGEYLHTLRVQAEAINNLVAQQQTLFNLSNLADGARRKLLQRPTRAEPAAETGVYTPHDKELRTWAGFRARYQWWEHAAREAGQLKAEDPVTPHMLWEQGAPSPRTTARILRDRYGLDPRLWPPSSYPEQPPPPQAQPSKASKATRAVSDRSHQIGLGLAAVWTVYLLLDQIDGHYVDRFHACMSYVQHLVHAVRPLI